MAQQAPLKLPPPPAIPPSLLDVVNACLRTYGPRKQSVLAAQLGVAESHLSEVLGGNGKHLPELWLKFFSENYDPENRIASHVAAWRGLTVRPARRITDAARVRAQARVLARLNGIGEQIAAEIEAEALAEPETDEDAKGAGR